MAKREREKAPVPGSLGYVVRELRKAKGWSQEQLAEKADLGQNDISRVETGVSKNPQDSTLEAIATALGVPLGLLYERTRYPEVSYQIAPLRTELKSMPVDQQTVMTHLARFLKEHEAHLAGRDPEEIIAFFARAVEELSTATNAAPKRNGTPV